MPVPVAVTRVVVCMWVDMARRREVSAVIVMMRHVAAVVRVLERHRLGRTDQHRCAEQEPPRNTNDGRHHFIILTTTPRGERIAQKPQRRCSM